MWITNDNLQSKFYFKFNKIKNDLGLLSYCIRKPNAKRKLLDNQKYKKGYEIRIAIYEENDIPELIKILNGIGIINGKPYKKHEHYVMPIYSLNQIRIFRNNIEVIKNKNVLTSECS